MGGRPCILNVFNLNYPIHLLKFTRQGFSREGKRQLDDSTSKWQWAHKQRSVCSLPPPPLPSACCSHVHFLKHPSDPLVPLKYHLMLSPQNPIFLDFPEQEPEPPWMKQTKVPPPPLFLSRKENPTEYGFCFLVLSVLWTVFSVKLLPIACFSASILYVT